MTITVLRRHRWLAGGLALLLWLVSWPAAPALEHMVRPLRGDPPCQGAGGCSAPGSGYDAPAGFAAGIRSAVTPAGHLLNPIQEVANSYADGVVALADIPTAREAQQTPDQTRHQHWPIVLAVIIGAILLILSWILTLRKALAQKTRDLQAINQHLQDRAAVLQENADLYRAIVESPHVVKLLIEPDTGRITEASQAAADFYGYSREELRHLPLWDISTSGGEEVLALLSQVARSQPLMPYFSAQHRLRSGEIRDVTVYVNRLHRAGRVLSLATVMDVTDRKRAEAARDKSEAMLRMIYDLLPVGISITAPDGQLVDCNQSAERLLGISREEHLRRHYAGREWRVIRPDGTPMPPEEYASVRAQTEQRVIHDVDLGVVRPDGVTWLSVSAMPSAHPDYGVIITYVDITARKQMEDELRTTQERLEAMINALPDLMFRVDREGVIHEYHSSAVDQLYVAPSLFLGQKVTNVLPEEAARIIMAALEEAAAQGSHRGATYALPMPAATSWYELSIAAMGAPKLAGDQFIILARDITERKQLEQDLRASEQRFRELNADLEHQVAARTAEARAASAAKSEFLAHMSHEIRTPLNAVLGLAQVLNREPLTANQRAMVERIQAAGQSLLALINDVLDFSKIEAGQLRLEPRPFDLETLLAKLNSLMGQAAQAKGLALRVEPPATPLGWLVGDALRLEQVLLNLMGNAIKFTERGEVAVRVQPGESRETSVRLRFEVQDTGIGIAPEALARLFQPFTQVEAGITRRFGGTGLGLSICKRLVELMGGAIGVDSQVGQGSTCWFELPFRWAAESKAEAPVAPAPALPKVPRLAGVHLLVVDDSAINRDVAERMLTLEGARVTLAADGQQAIQHLKVRPAAFAAVLMDVQMPVLDGLSATRAIRSELGLTELPVIALTAGVLAEQQQAARDAGVNDFLAKPVDLEQMVAALLRWTGPPAPVADVLPPAPEAPPPAAADQTPSAGLPEIAGFDAQQVALTFGDDREFFLELLGMFCASFRNTAQEVRADLALGAREAAARRLHTLKGTAGNLGALELMRSAQALERVIHDGQPDVETRLEQFTIQLDDLIQAAAPWLRVSAGAPPLDPVASMLS